MDTILIILGVIIAIIAIIGIYYLLKIILAYILSAILFAVIFTVISGIVCSFISKTYILEIMFGAAIVGAVVGLITSILSTTDWIKSDLASKAFKDMTKADPIGTKYTTRDQYGNKTEVEKTGRGILGETYYTDSNNNHYERSAGDDKLK